MSFIIAGTYGIDDRQPSRVRFRLRWDCYFMSDDDNYGEIPLPEGASVWSLTPDLALFELLEPEARIPPALTDAEQDIALRVFQGETTQQIARARGVSSKTIGNQLESIFRKLGVTSRAELVLFLRHVPRPKR